MKEKDGKIKEKVVECNPEPENALKALLGEFIASVETGRMSGPTGEDARRVLQIVGRTYKLLEKK